MNHGYAAVITVNWEERDVMWTIFDEADNDEDDPLLRAQRFRAAVGDDFPNHEHHLIANERASDLQVERLLGALSRE